VAHRLSEYGTGDSLNSGLHKHHHTGEAKLMSYRWWNKSEHVRWWDYRHHYHTLPIWARKWGNWLGMGHITNDHGDPVDEYLKLTIPDVQERPRWPSLYDLDVADWQLDFQFISPEKMAAWFRGDPACLTGHPVCVPEDMPSVDLGTQQTLQKNIEFYKQIGFLRQVITVSIDPRRKESDRQ
jgi:hypothetical protein